MLRLQKTLLLVLASFGVLGLDPVPASSAADSTRVSTGSGDIRSGWGESYWGTVRPPRSVDPARYSNHSMPLWEAALVWPYRVIGFPLKAFSSGVKVGVVAVERSDALGFVQALLAPRELLYGFRVNMTAGGLPGLGGGITFFHNNFLGPRNTFELRAKGTVRGSNRLTLGMRFPGSPDIQIGAGYRVEPNARFFGIGPEASEDRESFYTLQQNWAGISAYRHLPANFGLETEVLYTEIGARGPGDDYDPRLGDAFAGVTPAGYGRTSDGVTFSLALAHDDSPGNGRPQTGGRRRIVVSRFDGTSGEEAAFWTYRAEIQQFVPLWFSKRALGVRGFISRIDSDSAAPVPFQRLMVNDDPDLLRGYNDFRWRDRGMLVGTAEYRWPVWVIRNPSHLGMDAYLFTDVGQVFGRTREISLDHLTTSYGFGFRLANDAGFLARLEFGWSEEESVIRFRTDQVFQFDKGSLFYGRYPVPER